MHKIALFIHNLIPRGAQYVARTLYQYHKNFYDIDIFAGYHIFNQDILPATITTSLPHNIEDYDVFHLHFCGYDWGLNSIKSSRERLIVTEHQVSPVYSGQCKYNVSVYPRNGFLHIDNPLPDTVPDEDDEFIKNIINGKPYSLTVGTFTMEKGADIFLNIAEKLNTMNINMVFVGGRKGESYFDEFIWKYKLLKNRGCEITVVPSIDQQKLSALIKNSRALLHTSRSEASSLVLLEAQKYAIPIICLDVGGNRHTAPKAVFTDPRRMHEFPSIFFDRALLRANAQRISERNDPTKIASKYKELYDSIISNKH